MNNNYQNLNEKNFIPLKTSINWKKFPEINSEFFFYSWYSDKKTFFMITFFYAKYCEIFFTYYTINSDYIMN
jgi:hypothetical protein